MSKVKINRYTTCWLTMESGIRQGDSLSPKLFAIYINDLAKEMKQLNMGIPFDNDKISIFLYADDIVILPEDPAQHQILLNFVNTSCKNWKMKFNKDKMKIVHYRKMSISISAFFP